MQLFELVSPRLFRPLAGPNRAFYAELLLLLWEECRHTADYSISRAEAVSRAEDYFAALAKPLTLDADGAGDEEEQPTRDPHTLALGFLLRLRRTGWLEEQPGSYESEPTLAFVPEVAPLLDALEEVLNAGHNVVVLAHAAITKFEQPDAVGNYDRWSMKTSKQVAPLLREWCDMLLFANYKTVVEKAGSSPNAKNKASGGRRVLYTTHHPCWDAKNRFGLPEELPLDYASIAACIPGSSAPKAPSQRELAPQVTERVPAPSAEADILPSPVPQPQPPHEEVPPALLTPDLVALGVPEKLAPLMSANNVTPEELQAVVGKRGYFPEDMPIRDYPADFVEGCLVAAWPQVLQMVLDSRDLPF